MQTERQNCAKQEQNLDSSGSLLPQLSELLISLFNLFIQALVLNLELLKVNQVQTLCQLLLEYSLIDV